MYVFLVPYRARDVQTFRREEVQKMIINIKAHFIKNNIPYKIVIAEQNDNEKFNRGFLINTAFLEAQKMKLTDEKYFHFNVDYTFNLEREFPNEIKTLTTGFIDLHRPPFPVLGAACVFDGPSYSKINGFPNDLIGWGGDDWAIHNRIVSKGIPIQTPRGLFNSGYVVEGPKQIIADISNNFKNMQFAKRNDIDTNGLTTCIYDIEGFGEFHNENEIIHLLIKIK
jgi:hypothetical protein